MTDDGRERGGTDDRADRSLPLTAEVGSEGGSYADPTNQVSTFGDHDGLRREEDRPGNATVATYATRSDEIQGGGIGTSPGPSGGMVRYPTEPPPPAGASQGRRVSGRPWRSTLVGAAAGALGAAVLMGVTRRRRRP